MFGKTTNSLIKNINWARKAIFSFSYVPLDIISWISIIVVLLSMLGGIVQLVLRLLLPDVALPGFTTIILLILLVSGIQLFALGVIGSYLAHIYDEVKKRPAYIVESIVNDPRAQND